MTRYIPIKKISDLKRGDIVRHISDAIVETFIIDYVGAHSAVGVSTVNISNPPEWEVLVRRDDRDDG